EQLGAWPQTLAASEPYTVYIATDAPHALSPLPEGQFRAEITVLNPPQRLTRGEPPTISVEVRNASELAWLAPQRGLSRFRVSVGNHWLGSRGEMLVHDDGRGLLRRGLLPGESTQIPLTINAPTQPGDYQLEIDMLQEGVAWFADKGSGSWRQITIIDN